MNRVWIVFFLALSACGVRGRPLPPEKPAHIGQGSPDAEKADSTKKKQKTEWQNWDDKKANEESNP